MTPVETLERGGILLYPTDTLYGLGVDATNTAALQKLKELKGREPGSGKTISIIVADMDMAEEYAEVTPLASRLAARFLPGKLTLVLKAKTKEKNSLPEALTAGTATIGIRIPNHAFCLNLAREFGRPFTATSANKAGEEAHRSVPEILAQLGEKAPLVDRIVDSGELMESPPSTVVDARGEMPIVIREGAVPSSQLH